MAVRHDAGVSTTDPAAPGGSPGAPAVRHRARSRLVLVLAWLLATVLAATVAWWAVTAVGGERGGDRTGLVSQAEVERLLAEQGAGASASPGGPSSSAGASPEPTGTSGTPGTPTPTPTGPTTAPGAGTTTPPATEPPPAPDPAAPAVVARTWDVTGGQVSAVCTGATIGLAYATPSAGWSVEVESTGPQELEVDFSRGDERSRVGAECIGGTPEITRSGNGGGGGDDSGGDDGGGDDGGGGGGGGDDGGGSGGRGGDDDDRGRDDDD